MSKERRVFQLGFDFWLKDLQEGFDLSTITIEDIGMMARAMRLFCVYAGPELGMYEDEVRDIFDQAFHGDRYCDNPEFIALLGLPMPPELKEDFRKAVGELEATTKLRDLFHRECGSKKRRKAFNKVLRELDDFANPR